ncbi:hypothetical protein [Streptomyces phaeochromogenes]|uniref:hypothetical protein n=1 Tax=Streptomyces phaeochromogenes TaxID=1923 RepID=UPI002DD971FE|nr:hypothetical protein [Streptomyces phaeochromogenes]WRZ32303.1 hypothetical protein OG931_33505 [Streptomyces phaeochromogenes]
MKALFSSKPVLWFLFLFNLVVAVAAPFVVEGSQGVMTAVGMGVVSLGAGLSLLKGRGQAQAQGQRQGQRA